MPTKSASSLRVSLVCVIFLCLLFQALCFPGPCWFLTCGSSSFLVPLCSFLFFSFLWLPCFAGCWVLRFGPTPMEKYTSRVTCVLIPIAFLHVNACAGLVWAFVPEKCWRWCVLFFWLLSSSWWFVFFGLDVFGSLLENVRFAKAPCMVLMLRV